MSIATELTKLQERRDSIVTAINDKGGECASGASLAECATAIANIPSGGGDELIGLIERSLTSITIPSSVTSIGNSAFNGCSSLTSITIPSSVTSIGGSAFSGCTGLTSITIPSSVTRIGNYAFYYCSALTSITIPSSVTSIGGSVFYYCSALTSITIPSSVTSIGNYAFNSCRKLTSIDIPSSVTSIGTDCFRDMSSVTKITIGNGIKSIGDRNFYILSTGKYEVIINAQTPPSLGSSCFNYQPKAVYVPDDSVDAYKTATNWSAIADYIKPLSEYVES